MPLVGSSRTRSSGLPTNAFATKTRWVWPPDSRPIRRSRRSWMSNNVRISSASLRSRRVTPRNGRAWAARPRRTVSRTVAGKSGYVDWGLWGTYPRRRRPSGLTGRPKSRTEPRVGFCRPRITASNVDLPAPFGPRSPRRSWGKTRRWMPSMARMPPGYSTATSRSSRTGSAASDMVQGQPELGEAVLHLEEICHPEGLVREGQPLDRVQPDERGIRLARDGLRNRGVREGFIADVAEVVGVHRVDHVLDLRRGRVLLERSRDRDLGEVVLLREVGEGLVERDEESGGGIGREVDELRVQDIELRAVGLGVRGEVRRVYGVHLDEAFQDVRHLHLREDRVQPDMWIDRPVLLLEGRGDQEEGDVRARVDEDETRVVRARYDARDPRLEAGPVIDQDARRRHGLHGRGRRIECVDVQGHRHEQARVDSVPPDVPGVVVYRIEGREDPHSRGLSGGLEDDDDIGPGQDQGNRHGNQEGVANEVRPALHRSEISRAYNKDS